MRARGTSAAAVALALAFFAGGASGQDMNAPMPADAGAPRMLPAEPMPAPTTPSDMAGAPSPPPEDMQAPVRIPLRGAAVQVGDLGTLEGPVAGTLDNANGGLGSAAWQASDRDTIVTMLQAVPAATPSAAQRLLMRKVLLTAAVPPPGRATVSFNQLRLTKLLEGGYVDDAADLALRIQAPMNFDILRTQTDALLYAGREKEVCSDLTAHRLESAESFWVELRAFCYAVAGDTGPLDLTRAVIGEQGIADPAFLTLLDGMTSGKPVVPTIIRYPDSIHVVMTARLKLPMTADMAMALGMPASLLTAASATTPRPLRVAAAEKAFRVGVLPVSVMNDILDSASFSPQDLNGAPALARGEPLMDALARLRAALKSAGSDEARAELVHTGFEIGEREGLLAQVAGLFVDEAAAIQPAANWSNWSDLMMRGLLLANRPEAAQRWFDILDRNAPGMADTVDQLELSLALSAPNARRNDGARRLLEAMASVINPPPPPIIVSVQPPPDPNLPDPMALPPPSPPPPPPPRPKLPAALLARATLDLGLYDALGELNSPETQAAVQPLVAEASSGRRPAPVLMQRIDKAALSDARGEAA
ncbi:MAG TPA: hypothetical protein VNH44_06745, partial [Micropepsaceae bacterium]|nr:hypothetical protein [Micropepsaceae bacterium]